MMLQSFMELKEFIDTADPDFEELMPTSNEMNDLKKLRESMSIFQLITMQLQMEGINMYDVRVLFDAVLKEIPALALHLSKDVDIIHSKEFENAIVRLLCEGDNCSLSDGEKAYVMNLKVPGNGIINVDTSPKKLSFAEKGNEAS